MNEQEPMNENEHAVGRSGLSGGLGWLDPFNDLPSWKEIGSKVEAELNNGAIVIGVIEQYDMTSGPDEQPLFLLKTAESEISWFDDIKRFRFMPNV